MGLSIKHAVALDPELGGVICEPTSQTAMTLGREQDTVRGAQTQRW